MKRNFHLSNGRNADLSAAEIEDLRQGTWSVDCPRLEVRQRGSSTPRVFIGPGHFRQNEHGRLAYKLYAPRPKDFKKAYKEESGEAGTIIPESGFYDVTALDYKAREWKSERVLPGAWNWSASREPIVTGTLDTMWCEGKIPADVQAEGSSLGFLVFEKIEIPRNAHTSEHHHIAGWSRSHSYGTNAWRFRAAGFGFLLANDRKDTLQIRASTKAESWPSFIEERILESLFWVLGHPIYPTVTERRCGHSTRCTLYSRRRPLAGTRHKPPLLLELLIDEKTNKITAEPYRKLFERYLTHCLAFEERRHPLWAQLNAIYEASAASFIDAQALTLAVSIESILGREFPDLGHPSDAERRAVDEGAAFLKTWNGDKVLKERMIGSIKALKSARVGDKMRVLAEQGAITKETAKAWQKLRNVNTHTYQTHGLSPDEFRNLLSVVQTLFSQLIFHTLGYKGIYNDYSVPDWPLKRYPPLKAERATGKEINSP